jgi:hypothetical protein
MPRLDDVMKEFAIRRSMQPPVVDDSIGNYALAIDGRYAVYLRDLGREVAAWIWFADLPTDQRVRDETVRRALRAELALFGEDDVVLGLDQAASELHLHRLVQASTLSAESLKALLQSLVNAVERRRSILAERPKAPPVAPMIIQP